MEYAQRIIEERVNCHLLVILLWKLVVSHFLLSWGNIDEEILIILELFDVNDA